MNLGPTFTRPTKSLLAGLLVVAIAGLAIGWTAGTVAASSGSRAASATAAPKAAGADAPGVPTTTLTGPAGGITSSSGTTSSIAYPISGYDSLGVAPQGTILAEGTGTADAKTNGSDQAAALKKATDGALADAHAQALAAASAMGVQLQDIYSVSISTNTSYTYPTPGCPVLPITPGKSGATGSAGSAPASPPIACPLTTGTAPSSAQLVVTLIVAYKYA